MKSTKRPQSPKSGNIALAKAMQELRRSSAASPHRSAKAYTRKMKHREW